MLRLLGCACILVASSGMAYTCVMGLGRELRQAELLLGLLTAIEGEITYSRCPLPELLLHLSGHMPNPYRGLLAWASRKMEDNTEADIPALWEEACTQFLDQLAMPKEAYSILLRMGEVFSYSSLDASLQLLQLERERLDAVIQGRHAEFAGKRKLYCCLCYMVGLFSMILLL